MNKNTKRWLNYGLGGVISLLLLWGIYIQVKKQLKNVDTSTLWDTGPLYLLCITIILMPINVLLEARKWQLLAANAQPTPYRHALTSYLAGIAISLITPNRVGEYPGRLIYMRRKNTTRLIGVAILGSVAQLLTMFIYGMAGLIYFNIAFPGTMPAVVLSGCVVGVVIIFIAYWRFDVWMPLIEKIKWLRRYNVYAKLLRRFTTSQQLNILFISFLRYAIYTAQYVFLLWWMKVNVPLLPGFLLSALFFWAIAMIPSISLLELGERGGVGLYLFGHFSDHTVGILTATFGIWCINLILPAIAGSLLLFKTRLVR